MDFIEVEIVNWQKFNPRKDYKRPWWFAVSNTITEDPMWFEFSDAEFRAWIHILCLASKANSARVRVFLKHSERVAMIKARTISSAISKLKKLQVIRIPDGFCTDAERDPNDICTPQNRTEQNKTEQNTIAQAELERVYSGYPRKEGKARGIQIARREIKTPEDLEALRLAVGRYAEHISSHQTERRFVKHFATFMGEWRDWLDPDHGSGPAEESTSIAEILKRREAGRVAHGS